MSLDHQIDDAALLATLVLVLLPLFTSTRENAILTLKTASDPKKSDACRQVWILGALTVTTVVVFLAGLPLWVEVLGELSPFDSAGVARSLFAIVWPLLIGLIVWQGSLICKALEVRSGLPT